MLDGVEGVAEAGLEVNSPELPIPNASVLGASPTGNLEYPILHATLTSPRTERNN